MTAAAAINRFLGASPMAQTPNHIPEVGKMVSAPDRSALVEIMAEAAYEDGRGLYPEWRAVIEDERIIRRDEITAALAAAEAAGYVLEKRG